MRLIMATLALTVALVPALDTSAEAQRYKRKYYYGDRYEHRHRTTTMDRQGRCVRDNGRPMDSLNLQNRCDREEFWQRFNDRGGNRD